MFAPPKQKGNRLAVLETWLVLTGKNQGHTTITKKKKKRNRDKCERSALGLPVANSWLISSSRFLFWFAVWQIAHKGPLPDRFKSTKKCQEGFRTRVPVRKYTLSPGCVVQQTSSFNPRIIVGCRCSQLTVLKSATRLAKEATWPNKPGTSIGWVVDRGTFSSMCNEID